MKEDQNNFIILYRFLASLIFGIIFSILFSVGSDITTYLIIGLFLIAFFIPLYFSEYMLGFVIGMTYTFGAILPMAVGSLIMLICLLIYKYVRTFILFVFKRKVQTDEHK